MVDFKGLVTFKEFTDFEELPNELCLLYDLRYAVLDSSPEEINMVSQAAEAATQKYKSVKTAFVVNKPKETAYSTLFSQISKSKKTQRQIFSTKSTALKWLSPNKF